MAVRPTARRSTQYKVPVEPVRSRVEPAWSWCRYVTVPPLAICSTVALSRPYMKPPRYLRALMTHRSRLVIQGAISTATQHFVTGRRREASEDPHRSVEAHWSQCLGGTSHTALRDVQPDIRRHWDGNPLGLRSSLQFPAIQHVARKHHTDRPALGGPLCLSRIQYPNGHQASSTNAQADSTRTKASAVSPLRMQVDIQYRQRVHSRR
jgi:hypothetical protein